MMPVLRPLNTDPSIIAWQQRHASDDHRLRISIINGLFLSSATIILVFRFVSRRIALEKYGADDWLALVAWLCTAAFVACQFVLVTLGSGRHYILVTDQISWAKVALASQVMYNPALTAFKISIIYLYRRHFPKRVFKVFLCAIGALILASGLTRAFAQVFICIPIEKSWSDVPGDCSDLSTLFTMCSAFNIFSAFVLLACPIPYLWKLRMSNGQRLQLGIIFLLGAVVCSVCIVRTTNANSQNYYDLSWTSEFEDIWATVELCLGLIVACLPTLRPLYDYVFHGARAARSKEGSTMVFPRQYDTLEDTYTCVSQRATERGRPQKTWPGPAVGVRSYATPVRGLSRSGGRMGVFDESDAEDADTASTVSRRLGNRAFAHADPRAFARHHRSHRPRSGFFHLLFHGRLWTKTHAPPTGRSEILVTTDIGAKSEVKSRH